MSITSIITQYRGLRKENYILFFGRIVTNLGAMIWPMMTLILNQKMGISADNISVIIVVAMSFLLPANILGGIFADRYNKKWNIIICDLVSICCFIISGIIELSYITIVLVCIAGVFQSFERPSYDALIADITTTKNREKAYSLQYLGVNIGLMLSPTIGGILFKDYLWLAFVINGLAILSSTVLIALKLKNIEPADDESEITEYQLQKSNIGLLEVIKGNKVIILYTIIIGIYSAAYSQYGYLLPIELGRIHGENGAVIFGTVTSTNCIIVVIFTPLITRFFTSVTNTKKILFCMIMTVIGMIIFWLGLGYVIMYYLGMLFFTIGEVFQSISDGPYVSVRVPSSHRGRIKGMNMVIRALFDGASMLLIGHLYVNKGSSVSWLLILLFIAVTILLSLILIKADKKMYPKIYKVR